MNSKDRFVGRKAALRIIFAAVIFLPQMTRIVDGSPEERRRYLNLALAQAVPGYAQALSDYSRALEQRNALLKLLGDRGGDESQLDFWDETLARNGGPIILARIEATQEIEKLAARIHRDLTHSSEVLRMHYQPAYDPLPRPEGQLSMPLATTVQRNGMSEEYIRLGFMEALQAAFDRHAAEILADIPNYTEIAPVMQISEVKIA